MEFCGKEINPSNRSLFDSIQAIGDSGLELEVGLSSSIFQWTIINNVLSIFRYQHLTFQFHVFTRIRRNWDPIRQYCLS